jgi:hypothetical protein
MSGDPTTLQPTPLPPVTGQLDICGEFFEYDDMEFSDMPMWQEVHKYKDEVKHKDTLLVKNNINIYIITCTMIQYECNHYM